MTNPSRPGALSRFTVLDASRVRAGPTAVRLFADMGARVIKLEIPAGAPGGDDMIGGRDHNRADYENLHRNKESLTLNMKTPEGVAILRELVKKADVFIENYRPDVKHRLGIGPDDLRAINPRLVYASISGFGQDGPYAGAVLHVGAVVLDEDVGLLHQFAQDGHALGRLHVERQALLVAVQVLSLIHI